MMMMMMNDGGIQIISKPKLMDFTCHYLVQLSFWRVSDEQNIMTSFFFVLHWHNNNNNNNNPLQSVIFS